MARGDLFSISVDSISVQDLCVRDESINVEKYCSCSSRIAYFLDARLFRMLWVLGWLLLRLHCSIAIVCVGRRAFLLFIKVGWRFAFTGGYILGCFDFVGAVFMPGRVVSFAACAFMGFAVAFGGLVVFAAFPANVMETSTRRGMMSELLAFVALDQLELRSVFLCSEPLVVNVYPMFDALIGHVCASKENH